jgi:signal transduction histidine kinase
VQATRETLSGSEPDDGAGAKRSHHRLFARVVRWISWLRSSRRLVVVLTVGLIAIGFALDLAVPGYAIAGFYLIPILLAAFAFPGRYAAVVGVLALALTVLVMVLQDRVNAQNILLVWFGVLSAAGLFALAYLYNRFDQLYESERRTTSRLHVLTSQLRALQEAAILEPAPRHEELLARIAAQARQLLGSDTCDVYRLHGQTGSLDLETESGPPTAGADAGDGDASRAVAARAVGRRTAVVEGSRLAVPLSVRDDVYGAIVLSDRGGRIYLDEDVRIATTFGDQAALAVENARLRERVERAAAAAERLRLARELHDSVTQSLFAASLEADVVAEMCPAEQPRVAEAVDDLRRLTRGALAEMRTMLLEMRPDGLARAPLGELLRHLAEAAQSRAHVAIDLNIGSREPLPEDVHLAFFRVAQEALNNVVKHAQAKTASVGLAGGAGLAELTVADDGCGFQLEAVSRDRLGIVSMQERAAGVGAGLDIATSPGRGTVVKLTWSGSTTGWTADE